MSDRSPLRFSLLVSQNRYLSPEDRRMHAILRVRAEAPDSPDDDADAGGTPAAEVIIVDCSGSMEYPPSKIQAARDAARAALDVLPDGVFFAVVQGTDRAATVYPSDDGMCAMTARTREEAKRAVSRLWPNGGTAIGSWLRHSLRLLDRHPSAVRHAILLTDGRNETESPEVLHQAVLAATGLFQCDCRGVGTDWEVKELRTVSTTLLGTVDIVPDPSGLAADFAAMMENAMGKQVADVSLRVWTPQTATLKFVKQVAPAVEDLTARRTQTGAQAGDYPTGAWGPGESRDYHVGVEVAAAGVGQEMLAARISLVAGTEILGQGLVRAIWTDDEALSTKINPRVAHYTGQAELADAIQEGLEARKQGDEETATARLGRAVALAHQSGNEDTAKLLAKVVDVVDVESGTVRLKKKVEDADEMALDTRSTKTVRVKK